MKQIVAGKLILVLVHTLAFTLVSAQTVCDHVAFCDRVTAGEPLVVDASCSEYYLTRRTIECADFIAADNFSVKLGCGINVTFNGTFFPYRVVFTTDGSPDHCPPPPHRTLPLVTVRYANFRGGVEVRINGTRGAGAGLVDALLMDFVAEDTIFDSSLTALQLHHGDATANGKVQVAGVMWRFDRCSFVRQFVHSLVAAAADDVFSVIAISPSAHQLVLSQTRFDFNDCTVTMGANAALPQARLRAGLSVGPQAASNGGGALKVVQFLNGSALSVVGGQISITIHGGSPAAPSAGISFTSTEIVVDSGMMMNDAGLALRRVEFVSHSSSASLSSLVTLEDSNIKVDTATSTDGLTSLQVDGCNADVQGASTVALLQFTGVTTLDLGAGARVTSNSIKGSLACPGALVSFSELSSISIDASAHDTLLVADNTVDVKLVTSGFGSCHAGFLTLTSIGGAAVVDPDGHASRSAIHLRNNSAVFDSAQFVGSTLDVKGIQISGGIVSVPINIAVEQNAISVLGASQAMNASIGTSLVVIAETVSLRDPFGLSLLNNTVLSPILFWQGGSKNAGSLGNSVAALLGIFAPIRIPFEVQVQGNVVDVPLCAAAPTELIGTSSPQVRCAAIAVVGIVEVDAPSRFAPGSHAAEFTVSENRLSLMGDGISSNLHGIVFGESSSRFMLRRTLVNISANPAVSLQQTHRSIGGANESSDLGVQSLISVGGSTIDASGSSFTISHNDLLFSYDSSVTGQGVVATASGASVEAVRFSPFESRHGNVVEVAENTVHLVGEQLELSGDVVAVTLGMVIADSFGAAVPPAAETHLTVHGNTITASGFLRGNGPHLVRGIRVRGWSVTGEASSVVVAENRVVVLDTAAAGGIHVAQLRLRNSSSATVRKNRVTIVVAEDATTDTTPIRTLSGILFSDEVRVGGFGDGPGETQFLLEKNVVAIDGSSPGRFDVVGVGIASVEARGTRAVPYNATEVTLLMRVTGNRIDVNLNATIDTNISSGQCSGLQVAPPDRFFVEADENAYLTASITGNEITTDCEGTFTSVAAVQVAPGNPSDRPSVAKGDTFKLLENTVRAQVGHLPSAANASAITLHSFVVAGGVVQMAASAVALNITTSRSPAVAFGMLVFDVAAAQGGSLLLSSNAISLRADFNETNDDDHSHLRGVVIEGCHARGSSSLKAYSNRIVAAGGWFSNGLSLLHSVATGWAKFEISWNEIVATSHGEAVGLLAADFAVTSSGALYISRHENIEAVTHGAASVTFPGKPHGLAIGLKLLRLVVNNSLLSVTSNVWRAEAMKHTGGAVAFHAMDVSILRPVASTDTVRVSQIADNQFVARDRSLSSDSHRTLSCISMHCLTVSGAAQFHFKSIRPGSEYHNHDVNSTSAVVRGIEMVDVVHTSTAWNTLKETRGFKVNVTGAFRSVTGLHLNYTTLSTKSDGNASSNATVEGPAPEDTVTRGLNVWENEISVIATMATNATLYPTIVGADQPVVTGLAITGVDPGDYDIEFTRVEVVVNRAQDLVGIETQLAVHEETDRVVHVNDITLRATESATSAACVILSSGAQLDPTQAIRGGNVRIEGLRCSSNDHLALVVPTEAPNNSSTGSTDPPGAVSVVATFDAVRLRTTDSPTVIEASLVLAKNDISARSVDVAAFLASRSAFALQGGSITVDRATIAFPPAPSVTTDGTSFAFFEVHLDNWNATSIVLANSSVMTPSSLLATDPVVSRQSASGIAQARNTIALRCNYFDDGNVPASGFANFADVAELPCLFTPTLTHPPTPTVEVPPIPTPAPPCVPAQTSAATVELVASASVSTDTQVDGGTFAVVFAARDIIDAAKASPSPRNAVNLTVQLMENASLAVTSGIYGGPDVTVVSDGELNGRLGSADERDLLLFVWPGSARYHRKDREFRVLVSNSSFECPLGDWDMNFTVKVTAIPPAVSPRVQEAIQSTAAATASASAVLGAPVTVMQQTKLAALMSLTYCTFDHTELLDPLSNPLRIGFGAAHGRYYRGAIVGGLTLLLSCGVFVILLGSVVFFVRQKHEQRKAAHSLSKPTDDEKSTSSSPVALLLKTFAFLHIPGILIIPYVLVTQGVAASSMALWVHAYDGQDYFWALLGVVIAWGPAVGIFLLTRVYFKCELQRRSPESLAKRESVLGRVVQFIYGSEWKWADTSASRSFKKHFMHTFMDYRVRGYLAAEVFVCNLCGMLAGIRVQSTAACTGVMASICVIMVLLTSIGIYVRPSIDRYNAVFLHGINTATSLSAILLLAGHLSDNDEVRATEQYFSTAAMCLGLMKFIGDCCFILLWLKGYGMSGISRKLTKMRNFNYNHLDITEDEMNLMGGEKAREAEQEVLKSAAVDDPLPMPDADVTALEDPLLAHDKDAAPLTEDANPAGGGAVFDFVGLDDLLTAPLPSEGKRHSIISIGSPDDPDPFGGDKEPEGPASPLRAAFTEKVNTEKTAEARDVFEQIKHGLSFGTLEGFDEERRRRRQSSIAQLLMADEDIL